MVTPSYTERLAWHALDLDADGHDIHSAATLTIADAGGYFTSDTIEDALQELGGRTVGFTDHGAAGASEDFDAAVLWHRAELDANLTPTFSGALVDLVSALILELQQDATGGRTVTWPGSVQWLSGSAPTLTTTPGDANLLTFFTRDGGATWYGSPWGGAGGGATTASAVSIADAGSYWTSTDVEGALQEVGSSFATIVAAVAAHLADAVDAHDAAAISAADAGGYYASTDVEGQLQELGPALAGTAGHWEVAMQTGVSSPPVPLESSDGTDWVYGWVPG